MLQSEDPIRTIKIFFHCPKNYPKTDPHDKSTWLDGWQLLERNPYNQFDICPAIILYFNINDSLSKIF